MVFDVTKKGNIIKKYIGNTIHTNVAYRGLERKSAICILVEVLPVFKELIMVLTCQWKLDISTK